MKNFRKSELKNFSPSSFLKKERFEGGCPSMSNFFLTLISTYTTPIEEEVKKLEKE